MLVATGEQVSVALVAMALHDLGVPARSFLGHQIRMSTDGVFGRARIKSIDARAMLQLLNDGGVAVVAGFQGVDEKMNITTLGRGGSDTSAVAMAAAVKADVCEIYTDVTGVFTTDPRICPECPQAGAHLVRRDAGAGQPRCQGAADPLGRVRQALRRAGARALEFFG